MKAKKYIQNLKQQAADATAAKDQALSEVQAVQQQLQGKSSINAAPDAAGDASVPRDEYEQLQVSFMPEFCINVWQGMHAPLQIYYALIIAYCDLCDRP